MSQTQSHAKLLESNTEGDLNMFLTLNLQKSVLKNKILNCVSRKVTPKDRTSLSLSELMG